MPPSRRGAGAHGRGAATQGFLGIAGKCAEAHAGDGDRGLDLLRLTVDTAEDLELLRQIYDRFPGRDDFSWLEVVSLLEREPELLSINAGTQHKHYLQVDERRQSDR